MQQDPSTGTSARRRLDWKSESIRGLIVQAIFLVTVLGLIVFLVFNTLANLESRGINTGFGFLARESGFPINQTLIDYSATSSIGRVFVVGLLNTLLVSALGILLATLLGFVIGVARLSGNWVISRLAAVYIEIFRNIPLLLQIFFWYFAVLGALPSPRDSHALADMLFLNQRGFYFPKPIFDAGFGLVVAALVLAAIASLVLVRWARRRRELSGVPIPTGRYMVALLLGLPTIAFFLAGSPMSWEIPALRGFNFRGGIVVIPELAALLLALSIYTAAFIAEIVRAGIQAISKGQSEAAGALGLTRTQCLRLVVIPQALRVIIPPLTSQYLNLLKNSSLATAIAYPDLVNVFAGTVQSNTGQAVEIIAMTMAVYLLISLLISLVMNWYNARIALVER